MKMTICCAVRLLLTLLLLLTGDLSAFLPCLRQPRRFPSNLFGWKEWSDQASSTTPRQVLLLPFAATEALVPGQSREIVLKQGRFLELIDNCMEDHDSVIGMALMGDDHFLETIILCELEDFFLRSGFRGKVTLDVTLRAVARAKLIETTQMKPTMIGYCSTFYDEGSPDSLQLANGLVDDIEILLQDLSRINNGIVDRRTLYDTAFERSLQTFQMEGYSISAAPEADGQKSLLELTAASWAILAVLLSNNKACIPEAIASVNLLERLQLGLKALLDEKFHLGSTSSPVSYDDGASKDTDATSGFQ